MKPKLIMGVLLASALIAFLWWRFQPGASQKNGSQTAHAVQPRINSTPTPAPIISSPAQVPIGPAKMTVITRGPLPESYREQTPNWSAVQVIVNSSANYETRLSAVSALSSRLTDLDWEVLRKFLLQPDSADRNQQRQTVKNQLMDLLCAMNPPPADLEGVLTRIYHDHQQDDVIRDYAVQHLAAYYEQIAGQENSANTLQSVQQVLWEAVKERGGSIGGTALLTLKKLSQEYPAGFDQSKIASSALEMAADNYSGESTHITAFQVCAQLKVAGALPMLIQAAQKGETISVRASAIGSLGLLGGPDQIPYLDTVVNGTEDRLKPVARHALEQIKARNNQLASQK